MADIDLRSEIDRLEGEVAALTAQLHQVLSLTDDQAESENVASDGTEMLPKKENPYVFGVDDSDAAAFDDFFNTYDPNLEKTRSFLLD